MAMIKDEEKDQKRILVLCVDRDGDLPTKAQLKTPIVGRDANLNAAVTLALKDPEEPDANAIFEAVRMYDELKSENNPKEILEIATLSGTEHAGVDADRKIVAELNELLGSFPAGEVILVSDGYTDEAVLPVVQSRVPVSSVRRIIVKHSESIEETAALFTRYLKMLVDNPRYSRMALGIPGLLILILGILYIFKMVEVFGLVSLFVVSAFLLVKGFGVDRGVKRFINWMKEYSPPPLRVQISSFSAGAGFLCMALGVYLGWTNAAAKIIPPADLTGWFMMLPLIAGAFIAGAITLIVAGVCIALLGRAIRWYLEHDARLLRNSALIVTVVWSRQIFEATSDLLVNPEIGYERLVFSIAIGILIGIASVLVIFIVHRSARVFFRETEEQVEEFGEG
jgi:putative membrane protein